MSVNSIADNIDDCATGPCNFGTCADLVNDYMCTCYEGFVDAVVFGVTFKCFGTSWRSMYTQSTSGSVCMHSAAKKRCLQDIQ